MVTSKNSIFKNLAATLRAATSFKEANTESIHHFSFLPSLGLAPIKTFSIVAALSIGLVQLEAQEIATWAGFRSGVATFTFDDNLSNQLSIAVPIFDKYGYKASFYIVNNWSPNYAKYKELAAQGYEIGSHSDSHANTMPDSEIASSKATIEKQISNQQCNTITYPNCNVPNESLVSGNYIGGRICSGQIDGKTPQNYNRISSIICGNTGSVNTSQAFQQKMQEAIGKNGWVTFLIHEVDEGSGYSPTKSSAIDGALAWAKQNDSKIWVTTFRNAIMYSKERDASTITKVSGDGNSETYRLSHSLSTTLSPFDYPLSIRVKNSGNWQSVTATQKGSGITAEIRDGYIYFDAVPNGGDIVIANGSTSSTPDTGSQDTTTSKTGPFQGAIQIPGIVEAENYDIGAFSDSDGKSDTTGYRTDDAGIVGTGDGFALGYTTAGDFFEYTIDVTVGGKYTATVRGATGISGESAMTLSIGDQSVQARIPGGDSWNVYSEVEAGEFELSPGTQTLRLTIDDSYLNIDWIQFKSMDTDKIVKSYRLDARPGKLHVQVFDINGHLVKTFDRFDISATEAWNSVKSEMQSGIYILRYRSAGTPVRSLRVSR